MKFIAAIFALALFIVTPAQAVDTPLGLENYKDIAGLQAELDRRLPKGASMLGAADKLFDQEKAFRSDNLINGLVKQGNYSRGSSSAENYAFYFKPEKPAGKEGWEEAADGWVVKVTFSGGGFSLGQPKNPALAQDMIMAVAVLAVPGQDTANKGEAVGLAKQLLAYKREGQPVKTFDEEEWEKLAAANKSLPCKTLDTACLMGRALPLTGMPDKPARDGYRIELAEIALKGGDRNTAKLVLKNWPDEAALQAMEKEATDPARRTPASSAVYYYRALYPKLLFLSGDYAAAEKFITARQEKDKAGEDYGAIVTLVTAGALDEALKTAKMTLEWKREARDDLEGSSAHGHCENYRKSRATGMAKLARAFAVKGETDKAYETAKLLLAYWENKGYGQTSYCQAQAAQYGYVDVMTRLMRAHAAKGEKEKAAQMSRELQDNLMKQTKSVRRWGKEVFEDTAKAVAETGSAESLKTLAAFVAQHSEMDYPDVYRAYNNDPVPLIYALAGEHGKAVELLSQGGRIRKSELELTLGVKDTGEDTIRLATYFKTITALAEVKDNKGAIWFLDKATPLLAEHKKNIKEDDDIFIYLNLGRTMADIGETLRSRTLLDDALGLLKNITDNAGPEETRFNYSLFGQAAQLYLRHAKLDEVLAWMEKQPVTYDGFDHARMAAQLAKENRWEEFDTLLPQAMAHAYGYNQPPQNMDELVETLMEKGETARYKRFVDLLATPPANLPKTPWVGTILNGPPPAVESRHYRWAVMQPIMRAAEGKPVPAELVADAWPRYIGNCKEFGGRVLYNAYRDGNRLPDAKETMAGCYLSLVQNAASRRQWAEMTEK